MRVLLATAALMLAVTAAFAAPPPDAAFITMTGPGIDMQAIDQVISTAAEGDGHIYHVMPFHTEPGRVLSGACLIGTVLPGQEGVIAALPFVTEIQRSQIDPAMLEPMGEEAVFAANAWNYLLTAIEEPPPPGAEPLDDARPPHENGEPTGEASRSPSLAPLAAPGQFQTSEFMIGRIAIGVVLPESSGSGENWSNTDPLYPGQNRRQIVYNKIVSGANWWGTSGGTQTNLTFFYDQRLNTPTTYEPITINSTSDGMWISNVLNNMGFTGPTDVAQCYSYDNWMRNTYSTDWAFCAFVADSLNDSDGRFPDNFCAYAWLYGPNMVMTYDNYTWTVGSMHLVFAHEMGHIFGAPDEYQAWSCTCSNYGYLGVYNGNCVNCTANQVPCVMVSNVQQMCNWTKGHIGWQDTDGDGIFDPVDAQLSFPSAYLDYFTPPYWGNSQIQGHGTVRATITPGVSWTRSVAVINRVLATYSVNGGPMTAAVPTDGAFDSDNESFDFTTTPQADGTHVVAIGAVDNYGAAATVAPPFLVTVDTTPPPALPPPVTIVEAPYSSNPSQCSVTWNPSPPDPESGIAGHQVTLRRPGLIAPVGTQYVPMPMPNCQFTGLTLGHGTSCTADVQAVNGAGVKGAITTSQPLTIDLTPPGPVATMSDSGAGTSMLDRLTFSWSAAPEDISGISNYLLHVRDDLNNWVVTGQSTGPNTSHTATGLPLIKGMKYFGHVVPVNGAGTVGLASPESDGILTVATVPSIASVKLHPLGSAVGVSGLYVTSSGADQPGVIYVEQGNRSAGIRTDSTDSITQSQYVEIAGILRLNALNELYLSNSEVAQLTGTQTIYPLGLPGRSLGGSAFGQQPGVTGGSGLNNIGLLVRTWGRVVYVSSSPPYYFVIDDGSGCVDPAGWSGIGVRCGSISPPAQGVYVTVTGVCSYEGGYPVVLLRQVGDWH